MDSKIEIMLKNHIKELEKQITEIKMMIKKLPENKWYEFRKLKEYKELIELDTIYGDNIIPISNYYNSLKKCSDPNCMIPHIFKEYDIESDYGGEFGDGYIYFLCNYDKLEIIDKREGRYITSGCHFFKGYYIKKEGI